MTAYECRWVNTEKAELFNLTDGPGTDPVNVNWVRLPLGWKQYDFLLEECDFQQAQWWQYANLS